MSSPDYEAALVELDMVREENRALRDFLGDIVVWMLTHGWKLGHLGVLDRAAKGLATAKED